MYIIGGKHKRRKLFSPKAKTIRPTSSKLREALFNICQNEIEGTHFLDLFAGSGAVGLEALSRGALHATFVEKERSSLLVLKKNISLLGEEANCSILPMDAFDALSKLDHQKKFFDIIFADPPYTHEVSITNRILKMIDCSLLLSKRGILFLEDDEKASKEECALERLELIASRRMGRSLLREYTQATIK